MRRDRRLGPRSLVYPGDPIGEQWSMRILVSGSTGLIGAAAVERLRGNGHEVVRLVRSEARAKDEVSWSPAEERLEVGALEGCDAVLHLAGESIAGGRWTAEKKRRIRESRTKGTRLLADAAARAENGPRTFVSVSAIGYYGDRGDEWAREDDPAGELFISEVCVDWERAADPARQAGLRVVHPRIGVVLSPEGGALKEMLTPFKLGIGGKVGSGQQWMSWVALGDVVSVLAFCLDHDAVSGPVNAVAPEPVRNADFTKALGRAIHRPTIIPVPAFGIEALFGEMGRELLLASTRVSAEKIRSLGFEFAQPSLDEALQTALAA